MITRLEQLALSFLIFVVLLAGCGGDESSSSARSAVPTQGEGAMEQGPPAALLEALESGRMAEDQDPRTYPPDVREAIGPESELTPAAKANLDRIYGE